jgi:hypothetical protein
MYYRMNWIMKTLDLHNYKGKVRRSNKNFKALIKVKNRK